VPSLELNIRFFGILEFDCFVVVAMGVVESVLAWGRMGE
jgi:hypothetical protein